MHILWLAAVAIACAAGSLALPTSAPQGPAPQLLAGTYADMLVPYIGKEFYLTADRTIAEQKARTSTVPPGSGLFTLSGVAKDFAHFEDRTKRVCVPLTALRVVFEK